jgi:PAS domain S-box-containing protein
VINTIQQPLPANSRFKNILSELFDWFFAGRYLHEDTFTVRLRSYQVTAFVVLFVCSFLNFLSGLSYSYTITSLACISLIFVRHFIERNTTKTAYILLLLSLNIPLALLVYVEGLRSGAYLFFFPCVISFVFLADFTNKAETLLTYTICISSFIVAILVSPAISSVQTINGTIYAQHFSINVVLSFLLIGWMSISLSRENHRKQTMLRNKEIFLNTIFNSSLDGYVIVNIENGLISNHNIQAGHMFGVTDKKSIIGTPFRRLFYQLSQGDNQEKLYELVCNPSKNWEGELTSISLTGSQFPGNIRITSFEYDSMQFKKIVITDITEKKQMLNELKTAKRKAEELAAVKSQFLSHMSHELRTPLNGIIGTTSLMLQDKFLPEQKEQLNVLKFSSEHMLSLINDVLDLSKLDADKIKLESISLDIPKFINNLISSFANQFKDKGLQFEADIDPDLKRPVLTDPTRLNQVLANLLSNALKFTSSGSVKLSVTAISIKSDTNHIEFSVTDTGIGISEEKTKTIFEQFTQADVKTTRKYGGTGLGLSISKKLVEMMGGQLKVESKFSKGSRFYFDITVPVSKSREKVYISSSEFSENPKLNGLKVLIAEDNPVNMMVAARFLEKWGVSYAKAVNGLEAISLFEKQNFDILLLDLDMPDMDGYGALNAIRKRNNNIPAIAFTAAVFDNMKEKLTESGFNDYVQKPFRPEELHSKLLSFSGAYIKKA